MPELTALEREILQFETDYPVWKYPAAKEARVYDTWDLLPTRYHQILQALLERPEALTAFPQTVRRLTRLRDARRAARSARIRLGSSHDARGYDRQPGPQDPSW